MLTTFPLSGQTGSAWSKCLEISFPMQPGTPIVRPASAWAVVRKSLHVAFFVGDQGQGERLPHLFRRFFRLDSEGSAVDLVGAGLSLVGSAEG